MGHPKRHLVRRLEFGHQTIVRDPDLPETRLFRSAVDMESYLSAESEHRAPVSDNPATSLLDVPRREQNPASTAQVPRNRRAPNARVGIRESRRSDR